MKKTLIAALIAGLSLASVSAAAAEMNVTRSASPVGAAENLDGPTLTALVVLAAVIAGVVIAAEDDEDVPASA